MVKFNVKTKQVIIFVVIAIFAVTFDFALLKEVAIKTIFNAAQSKTHLNLAAKKVSLKWFGFELTDVTLTLPRSAIPLHFDSLTITCSPLKIFSASYDCRMFFNAYSGNGEATYLSSSQALELNLKDLHINQHPFFISHGFSGGKLSIQGSGKNIDRMEEGSFKIQVSNLAKTQSSMLSPSISGMPIPIELGVMNAKNISLDFLFNFSSTGARNYQITNLAIDSNLFTSPDAQLPAALANPNTINLTNGQLSVLNISLLPSQQGLAFLRPYAQFLCPAHALEKPNSLKLSVKNGQATCTTAG